MVRRPESTSGHNIPTHYQPPPPPLPPVQRHEVHVTVTVAGDPSTTTKLDLILAALGQIRTMEAQQMAALSDIEAGVEAESDVITSVETLVTNILAQVQAAGSDAERQAIFDRVTANKGRLAALVAAGTPVDGGDVPEPVDEPV